MEVYNNNALPVLDKRTKQLEIENKRLVRSLERNLM